MSKLSAFDYGSASDKTIAAATRSLDGICGKMSMLGLSVYTPTTDPSYAKDLMAQVLHTPNFDVEVEESKEIIVETNARHQWWVANTGRMVYPDTMTKLNGGIEDFSNDSLYSAIPKFPALPITPSAVSSPETIAETFTPNHLKTSPMNQMCEMGIDDDTKNLYTVLQPAKIIYMARRVLMMPMRTQKQLLERYNIALDVQACADAAVRKLTVFASEKFTQEQFRKALLQHGPFHATSLDASSPAVRAVIELATLAGVDFSSVSHMDGSQKTCWFVGRLLTDWMLAVRCLMFEAAAEIDDHHIAEKEELLRLKFKEEQRAKKAGRRSRRPESTSSFYLRESYPGDGYTKFGFPTYAPSGTYTEQGTFFARPRPSYPMIEAPQNDWYGYGAFSESYSNGYSGSRPNAWTYQGPSSRKTFW